jgi:hypothetical protein
MNFTEQSADQRNLRWYPQLLGLTDLARIARSEVPLDILNQHWPPEAKK